MTVQYQNTLEDLISVQLWLFRLSPAIRRQIAQGRILVLVTVALMYAFLRHTKQAIAMSLDGSLIILGLAILFFALYPTLHRRIVRRETRKVFEEVGTELLMPRSLSIDRSGLLETAPNTQHRIDWSTIDRIEVRGAHIYIATAGLAGLVIPKSAFDDEEQANSFRDMAVEFQRSNREE